VEPRKYRFRILNGSNARFYNLSLLESDGDGIDDNEPGPVFHQIGTDGGLIPATVHLKKLLIAPGERFDVIIDFSNLNGESFLLHNDAPAPYPDGGDTVPAEVMLFKVTKHGHEKDRSKLPTKLVDIKSLNPAAVWQQRDMTINELASKQDNPIIGLLDNKHFDELVTAEPIVGSTEIWRIINRTGDVHPLHVHPLQMQILDRQHFKDTPDLPQDAKYEQLTFDKMPVIPDATEKGGWKDTVKTYPGEVTRVIVKYELPKGTPYVKGAKYEYMWHCHILEHEDNEMMRPYNMVFSKGHRH
jgi:spore coat protein A, manganese oxidase